MHLNAAGDDPGRRGGRTSGFPDVGFGSDLTRRSEPDKNAISRSIRTTLILLPK
jgi:hypothetical protein